MLAQNISLCGNLFVKNLSSFDFNREENFLSSAEQVNAAGVVQEQLSAISRQLSGKPTFTAGKSTSWPLHNLLEAGLGTFMM
jgi:hypothetical protein